MAVPALIALRTAAIPTRNLLLRQVQITPDGLHSSIFLLH